MPTLLEQVEIKLEQKDMLSRVPLQHTTNKKGRIVPPSRHPGVHQSEVLKYIAEKSHILEALKDIEHEEYPLRWAMGVAWEEFCATLHPNMLWQPGEIEIVSGVWGNPDGMSSDPPTKLGKLYIIDEFKWTTKGIRLGPDFLAEWLWMQQGRGYCIGYDTNRVRWHVLFVNGDYKGSGPQYWRYLVQFTDQELESTRRMLVDNRDKAIGDDIPF